MRPHVQLRGTQLAGWVPRVRSRPDHALTLEHDVAIPLPDGTRLVGDVYRPRGPGRFPALVAWSSYSKELQHTGLALPINEVGVVGHIVPRGYVHVTVNARGSGGSAGTRAPQFSPQEQADAAAAVEWAAAQPWCDGNVGMVGMSYFAVIQYLVAAQRPPHLRAIFPYLGWTDFYRHAVYHGGAFQSDFFSFYYSLVGATGHLAVPPGLRHALGYVLDHGPVQDLATRVFLPLRSTLARRLHPDPTWMRDFATLAFDQPADGDFYRERSAWPVLDRITVPVCLGTNWGNPGLHMRGAFEAWPALRSPKKMFIGPPEPIWPWSTYQEELLAWYDHHLKGMDNGLDDLPPVRYWLAGADVWRSAADWPPPGAAVRRYHLVAASADPRAQQGLAEAPEADRTLSFVAVPRGMMCPRELYRYEADVLTYATLPFAADTELAGPLHLHLRLASSALDTHVVARVSDVSPDGRRRTLSYGWLTASHRQVDAQRTGAAGVVHDHRHPHALEPGEPCALDIALTPVANLFRAGHRLLLEVSSRPDRLPTSVLEGFVWFPYEAPPYPARNTVFHGADGSWLAVAYRRD